jgi:hypothetical protein
LEPEPVPERAVLFRARVSVEAFEDLRNVPKLENLKVICKQITDAGISFLALVASLRSLSLRGLHHITEQAIEHLTQIQELDLRATATSLSSPDLWSRMHSLTHLDISMLPISDAQLVCLKGATSLQHLFLNENNVLTGIGLEHLVALPLLELNLGSGPNFTEFQVLTKFQSLRVLNLMCAKLGDAGEALDYLPRQLQDLDLWATHVQNVGVSRLSKFVQLRKLGL